jgi:excisionase family DNA binding protein
MYSPKGITIPDSLDGFFTTQEAAEVLQVSKFEVLRLVHAGELEAVRIGNKSYLISTISAHEYESVKQGRGRPFTPSNAWGALWILSALEAPWLTYQQRRRIKLKQLEAHADDLVWLVRRRARRWQVRINENLVEKTRESLIVSGISSPFLTEIGLTKSNVKIEGYIYEHDSERVFKEGLARIGSPANATIHVIPNELEQVLGVVKEMPLSVVACDLASSIEERDRTVGLEVIGRLLDEQRRAS